MSATATLGAQRTMESPEREVKFTRSAVFSVMWAAAHIAHVTLHGGGTLSDVTMLAVLGAAIWVLLSPTSTHRLLILAAVQVADWIWFAPYDPDHWTLVFVVNLTLLITAAAFRGPVVETALPALRLLLLVAYGAAAFAKWNSTFLSVAHSCAVWLGGRASFGVSDHVPGSAPVLIAFALLSETMVFLLLLHPRTRRYGARLGLAFHAVVSLSPAIAVSDFTTTVMALFVLFLPLGEVERAVGRVARSVDGSPVWETLKTRRWIGPAWLIFIAVVAGYSSSEMSTMLFWTVSLPYVLVVLWAFLPITSEPAFREPSRNDLRPILTAIPVLVFLGFIVLSPYIGLRTTGAFTMFSNLRTEGSGSNHYAVSGVHLADYQNDLVVLESSSSEGLQDLADDGQALPAIGVRSIALLESNVTVVGTRGSEELIWNSSEPDKDLGSMSIFERWMLSFRPVAVTGPPQCGN